MGRGRGTEGLEVGVEFLGVGDGFLADEALSRRSKDRWSVPSYIEDEGLGRLTARGLGQEY